MTLAVLRYVLAGAIVALLTLALIVGAGALRTYGSLTTRERLASERARRAEALRTVAEAEHDSERQLWSAVLDQNGRP